MTCGFVIVDSECRIRPGFTRSCGHLLGQELVPGQDLCAALRLSPSQTAMFRMGIDQIFEDLMPEDVSVGQVPARVDIALRKLRLDARVVRDPVGLVHGVLLTIADFSAQFAAEERARCNAVLVEILRRKGAFTEFVHDSIERLASCREALHDTQLVRRAVHTIKGDAANYGLMDVVRTAHEVESRAAIGIAELDRIGSDLSAFLERYREVLGIRPERADRHVEVDAEQLATSRRLLDPVDPDALREWSAKVLVQPIHQLIGPIDSFVERLSERLGKRVDFRVLGGDLCADPETVQPALGILSHLIRNAMDHGLEPELERGAKPSIGSLELRFSESPHSVFIEVEDDGRGIDVDRIKERALQLGALDRGTAGELDGEELVPMIFIDGISSKAEVTDTSGRGVGMSAVRDVIQGVGGTVRVHTKAGSGTCVRLELPKPGATTE